MKQALIVFGKRPEPGAVKTRLTPQLADEEAADLYRAFVADTLARYVQLDTDTRFYLAGEGDMDVPPDVELLPQQGNGLGERMLSAFEETFANGYDRAVIVGTDHPTLPLRIVKDAFEHLSEPDSVVIGPAEDGGYYLLGMTETRRELFQQMTYSHNRVFEETVERLGGGAHVSVLPTWYDVDRPEELTRLFAELLSDPSPAPRTYTKLQELAARHPWLRD